MISVIIVNHNGRHDLPRCLSSLEASKTDFEIIVADNDSSDDSLDWLRANHPEVRILQIGENLGFGAGNNRAAAIAQGDALLLLNADAWVEPDAPHLLADRLFADQSLALVSPSLRYADGSRQFSWSPERGVIGETLQKLINPWEKWKLAHSPWLRGLARIAGPIWFTAACCLIRRTAFEEIGGFDEHFFMYFEDVDLCQRLGKAGWSLTAEVSATVFHAGGLAGNPIGEDLYRPSQLLYYRTHRPSWEARFIERRLRRRFGSKKVDSWIEDRKG